LSSARPSRLQPLVLEHQGITHHDTGHAGILLAELKQHRHDAGHLLTAVARACGRDLADQREHRLFDELDQALEHLCLARKVTVQSRLAHLQPSGQRGGGDALAAGLLQHGRQRLQDLHAPLAGLGAFARGCFDVRIGGFGSGTGLEVGHGGRRRGVEKILAQPPIGFVRRPPPASPSSPQLQWLRIMVP
jgi:hypothetical protein